MYVMCITRVKYLNEYCSYDTNLTDFFQQSYK